MQAKNKGEIRNSHLERILKWIYDRLYERFGSQNWWPGDTAFEIAIGAILTQNTSWRNVSHALENLKREGLLEPKIFNATETEKIATFIKPSGYYNLKAHRLKEFVTFLFSKYEGSLDNMFKGDPWRVRKELLEIKGIGLETADSILLYAGNIPIFVVDTYTRRVLLRHNLIDGKATYTQIQNLFMDNLPKDTKLFNEFHALFVQLGKEICKKKPNCTICPLRELKDIIKYLCDSCGRSLLEDEVRYILKIELYASPDVKITPEYLKRDHCKEMKRIIEEIKEMDEKELEDEVYVRYRFNLCKRCRDRFSKRVSLKEFI